MPESFIQDLYSFEAEEIINQNYFFKSLKDENQEQSIILCEICDKPLGDFISCKICSLNFHSKCIRPKISNTSDEEWTCPYCILDVSTFAMIENLCSYFSSDCLLEFDRRR